MPKVAAARSVRQPKSRTFDTRALTGTDAGDTPVNGTSSCLAFRKCGWSEIGAPLPLGPQPLGGRVVAMPIVKVTVKLGRTGVLI
jgi:hypothetical protein